MRRHERTSEWTSGKKIVIQYIQLLFLGSAFRNHQKWLSPTICGSMVNCNSIYYQRRLMLREEIYWEPWSIGGFTNFCRLKCMFFLWKPAICPRSMILKILVKSQPCWLLPGIFFAAKLPAKEWASSSQFGETLIYTPSFFLCKNIVCICMHHTFLKSNFPGFLSLPPEIPKQIWQKKSWGPWTSSAM